MPDFQRTGRDLPPVPAARGLSAAALADMNLQLGREINPVVMSHEQFIAKLNAGEHFVSRIMNEPKLFLIGDEHDLGKPA